MFDFNLNHFLEFCKKIIECPKSKVIFKSFSSDKEKIPSACPLCRNEIKEQKLRVVHRKKCIKLHLIWFTRYETLSKIYISKISAEYFDKDSLEALNKQLLKFDTIIEKEGLKWRLKFKNTLNDSMDIRLENFEFIKPITKGGYGQIFIIKDKLTGLEMIAKIISISEAIQRSCIGSYVNEREMLLRCNSDYVISCHYSFRSEFFIYQVS